MTATPQQHVPLSNFGTSATASVTATTSGRLLTMHVQAQEAQDIVGVTDSAGNTWLKADSIFPTAQKHAAIWYCLNANSITSVTINAHASTSMNVIGDFVEWAGSSGYALRGHNAQANSGSTTPPVCAATVQAGDLVVSALSYLEAVSGTRQDTIATGTVLDVGARGTTASSAAYKIAASSGTDGCTWTFSPSVSSGAATATFGPSNTSPTANAGSDQSNIEPYTTVQLDGSGSSDPDGSIASYSWSQTSGTSVSLSSSTAQQPTFTAPATLAGTTLVFSLTVTDNLGATSTADTVSIVVLKHTMWMLSSPITPIRLRQL